MKTLIAYSTTHGCTEKTAYELKDFLEGEIQICNLKKDKIPTLEKFQRVIIGGSIHAGQMQKKVKNFCMNNLEELKTKDLGLFICCMEKGETAQKQLNDAFPPELLKVSKISTSFGGEFNFEKMNFFKKLIVKKVAHVQESTSNIDHAEIKNFSYQMEKISDLN